MGKENPALNIVKLVLGGLLLIGMLVFIIKINGLNKQVIQIETRLSSMKPATQIQTQTQKVISGNNFGVSTNRTWLHPEVPNELSNDPLFTALPNSNYNTKINYTDSSASEEKGYNLIVNLSGSLAELYTYTGCFLAIRDFKDTSNLIGVLAERLEITDDGKEYTYYLKKNVKWHKPTVNFDDPQYAWLAGDHYVTAQDVKFTLETVINPQVENADVRSFFEELDEVKVIDDRTVVIRWKKRIDDNETGLYDNLRVIYPEFIYAYDESGNRIPKETFGLQFNNHWYNDRFIGCGPYRLKEHKQNQYVSLERVEDYFIGPKPVPKELKFEIIKDANLQYLKLKGGELDVITYMDKTTYRNEIIGGGPDSPFNNGLLKYTIYPRSAYSYIGWNNDHPIFKDKLVRRAMTYAIDREYFLNNMSMGLGTIKSGDAQIAFKEYDHSIKPLPYDLKKSRELLKEAGWKDKDKNGILEKEIDGKPVEFEFSLIFFDRPTSKTFFSRVKEDLMKIGIKMNVHPVDGAILFKKVGDKDYDAYTAAWGADPTHHMHQLWHSSQIQGSNYISYKNKRVDEIIDLTRIMPDSPERVALFHEAHRILNDEQPYTFMIEYKSVASYRSTYDGLIISDYSPNALLFTMTNSENQ